MTLSLTVKLILRSVLRGRGKLQFYICEAISVNP